jgi:hypothetical protein
MESPAWLIDKFFEHHPNLAIQGALPKLGIVRLAQFRGVDVYNRLLEVPGIGVRRVFDLHAALVLTHWFGVGGVPSRWPSAPHEISLFDYVCKLLRVSQTRALCAHPRSAFWRMMDALRTPEFATQFDSLKRLVPLGDLRDVALLQLKQFEDELAGE